MRAAVYARISRDDAQDEAGVERQLSDCRALIERRGWTLTTEYVDNDRSASEFARRPRERWADLVRDVRAGGIDVIVAYRSDRLYRSVFTDLAAVVALTRDTGVRIETIASGSIDLTSADGLQVATILAATGEAESRRMSERIRRQREQQVEQGRRQGGGRRPFGYTSGTCATLNDDEAVIVREVAESLLAGKSLYHVSMDLNARGVTTPSGARWRPANLKRMMTSGHIAALREHERTGTTTKGDWPPIITVEQHEALKARLESRTNTTGGRVTGRRGLLSGIVRCAECGGKLTFSAGRYYCDPSRGGCRAVRVNDGRALELHVLRLAEKIARERGVRRETRDDAAAIRERITNASRRLEELATMWRAGDISRNERNRLQADLEQRIANAESELQALGEMTDEQRERLHDALNEWMAHGDMTPERIALLQPGIIAACGDRVWVHARPRRAPFDASQVSLTRDA